MWFRSSKHLNCLFNIDVLESLSAQLHLAKTDAKSSKLLAATATPSNSSLCYSIPLWSPQDRHSTQNENHIITNKLSKQRVCLHMTIDIQSYSMFINFKISDTLSWTLVKQHHLRITGEVTFAQVFQLFLWSQAPRISAPTGTLESTRSA